MARNSQSNEKQGPTTKINLSSKAIVWMEGQIKSFSDKEKLREFIITKPITVFSQKAKGII